MPVLAEGKINAYLVDYGVRDRVREYTQGYDSEPERFFAIQYAETRGQAKADFINSHSFEMFWEDRYSIHLLAKNVDRLRGEDTDTSPFWDVVLERGLLDKTWWQY